MIIGRSRVRVPLPRTQKVNPPTWGQLKKITQEAEKIIQLTGQARNASNLFFAVIALVTIESGEELPENVNRKSQDVLDRTTMVPIEERLNKLNC
ncbi:Endogenous retrovirus group K member 8 Rec protein [Manis javanica]|nr:Endogenous retrovirus group K member 8 Rec protein [Manis javanica]